MAPPARVKLASPLDRLIALCETGCDHGCRGLGAFDLSPVHVASFLINSRMFDENAAFVVARSLRRRRTA
ncbi:MAG: DUF6331 family protein [Paracoccus sp. (in: a-proteobacteria)]|uniref:DUF6331 family protein n=1 Tax=Paracoccus sp. TaxID=267 RepID=UPI0039E6E388